MQYDYYDRRGAAGWHSHLRPATSMHYYSLRPATHMHYFSDLMLHHLANVTGTPMCGHSQQKLAALKESKN